MISICPFCHHKPQMCSPHDQEWGWGSCSSISAPLASMVRDLLDGQQTGQWLIGIGRQTTSTRQWQNRMHNELSFWSKLESLAIQYVGQNYQIPGPMIIYVEKGVMQTKVYHRCRDTLLFARQGWAPKVLTTQISSNDHGGFCITGSICIQGKWKSYLRVTLE